MKTESKPFPIRLKPQEHEKISGASRRLGITRSAVIKLAIATALPKLEAGVIPTPLRGISE